MKLQILECTLRDGSYVVGFQFTAHDTAVIAAALEHAGVEAIEIGHGLGLNASRAGKGGAAASDEEYLRAAADTLHRARWGMFFIPGIGRHEDLDLAASYRMPFVRIGTNAHEIDQAGEYIAHAKQLGMHVSANLMKSYALPPDELARQAAKAEAYGADTVVLVDSAGTMLPDDVRDYIVSMRQALMVPVGFHGHDNLSLAIANTLMAIECGAQTVDSTLQGLGRGAGNAMTDVLLAILRRKGIESGIDLKQLMDVSERIIRPLLRDKGRSAIDITSGYAGFHSSHLETILHYASSYEVDPRDLIEAVCAVDRVSAPEELVEETAQRLSRAGAGKSQMHVVSPAPVMPASRPHVSLSDSAQRVASEVHSLALKRGKRSVFNLVRATQPDQCGSVSPFVQETGEFIVGSAVIADSRELASVVETVDGVVQIMFVDVQLELDSARPAAKAPGARQSRVLRYDDRDVWVRAVAHQMEALRLLGDRRIVVYGTDPLALKLLLALLERSAVVTLSGDLLQRLDSSAVAVRAMASEGRTLTVAPGSVDAARGADVLVSFARRHPDIDQPMVDAMNAGGVVLDAGIGSVTPGGIAAGLSRGIRFVRPDMRAALAAEIEAAEGTRRLVEDVMGRRTINGVPIVAGGVIGARGDVVVDSISRPTRVIGIADGRGAVLYDARSEFDEAITRVEQEIWRQQVSPLSAS